MTLLSNRKDIDVAEVMSSVGRKAMPDRAPHAPHKAEDRLRGINDHRVSEHGIGESISQVVLDREAHHREAQRLAALRSYDIIDTPAEPRFDRIARMAAQVLETPIALISFLDETRQWVKASHGLAITDVPRQLTFCQHAIEHDQVMMVENALCDPRFFDNPMVSGAPYIRFYAAAPVRNLQGLTIGTLCVLDRQPRRIGPEQQRLLEDLAAMVIDELETRRTMLDLHHQAITDPLTGIHNRRQFLNLAEREVGRAARYEQPLCLLMCDIDRFKRINDTYGHEAGDRAICAVVEAIQRLLRPEAIFGRFGGEEFAILLPQADLAAALVAAERFRHAVRRQRLDTEEGPISFTVSIGIAPISPTVSLDLALQRADLALYDAKNAGRNRVRVFQAM